QVPAGLALTLFGVGLSAFVGASLVGKSLDPVGRGVPLLEDLPVLGELLFAHDPLVYFALALAAATAWALRRTRLGLVVRAVGEDHDAAHALGYRVVLVRLGCILYGGACAGLAGAYLSLVYTPLWAENMTAGRGWIALALVVFATWRPWWCVLGAYLFGGFTILQLAMQAAGFGIQSQYLAMLPYLATIAVLAWSSARGRLQKLGAPACLGKPFMAQ
ncbi:MAG: ABC transporter permease, partial [Betaproteobacteria bacterium AqS2]|nr:ABC transporter permease [Betaproteobacteria bacterium AqS2]